MSHRLRLSFTDAHVFRDEFLRNIASGGAFVRGACDAEVRSVVEVEIDLRFCSQSLVLEAEVVHSDANGVAVQFLAAASELRDRLEPLIREASSQPPAPAREDFDDLEPLDDFEDLDPANVPASAAAGHEDPLVGVAERRRSARDPAHLPVRLSTDQFELEGITRDLSEGGVLLSTDGNDLPVGKAVRIELRHPESGERLYAGGHVARRLPGQGTVPAVAVRFDAVEGGRERLREFVAAVRSSEQARTAEGISGVIQELGMPSLVRMLGTTSRQGTLAVEHASEEGVIGIGAGLLLYARVGSLCGLKALGRMLAWEEGHFRFHGQVDALDDDDFPMPLEEALGQASKRAQARERASSDLAPEDRFRVDWGVLASESGLAKTEEAVLDLAGVGFTVRRMIDVIPEPDGTVLGAIASLLDRGVLRREG